MSIPVVCYLLIHLLFNWHNFPLSILLKQKILLYSIVCVYYLQDNLFSQKVYFYGARVLPCEWVWAASVNGCCIAFSPITGIQTQHSPNSCKEKDNRGNTIFIYSIYIYPPRTSNKSLLLAVKFLN